MCSHAYSPPQPLQALVKDRAPFLRSRHNQFVLAFSFWPTANQRAGPNIYEIRSYFLKVNKSCVVTPLLVVGCSLYNMRILYPRRNVDNFLR